ncbi:hypothetical protein LZ654_13845 [Lelliottia amnigena]|uniref:hypothetical protein n=1 Tax=Lelliottia amnigena TaxID=61646 RepID=UPI001F4614A4|nr:hypothetical protein [Lelliottia amnigena]MCE9965901.1 hypothetical protein [Lelliottia amnigena]
MTTPNKPMTGEQLDELMTVAVNMQRDSEKAGDRPAAMFAYAVQVAVLEIRDVRSQLAKVAAENARLKKYICDECYVENIKTGAAKCAGLGMPVTPATDAILAEVRAQVWIEAKDFTKSMLACDSVDHLDFLFDGKVQQLRQGGAV